MRGENYEQVLTILGWLRGQRVRLSTLDRHMRACLCCLESKTRDERGELIRTILSSLEGRAQGELEWTDVRGMNGARVCASCKQMQALLRGGHTGDRALWAAR